MEYPLAALNAVLNSITTGFLLAGRLAIARQDREKHRFWMVCACVCSGLFLTSYVMHHAQHGSVKYPDADWTRWVYYSILLPHIVLAASLVVLVPKLLWHAGKGQFEAHRRTARWTWPIWMFVSVTGVIVYLMVYRPWG